MTRKKRNHEELDLIYNHGVSLSTREIFLHGYLSESDDPGVDYRMLNLFMKNLKVLEHESSEPIIIHQYSIGGYWSSGIAIYDLIKFSTCKFIFICHGYAGSMGSIIPQAVIGHGLRVSYPTCDWMLHDGSGGFEGTMKQCRSTAKYYEHIQSITDSIYVNACKTGKLLNGKTDKFIYKYLRDRLDANEDWYLSASDACDLGLIDGIYGHGKYKDIDSIKALL